eukprot:11123083-Heterocapsa_arctica.AAC.1
MELVIPKEKGPTIMAERLMLLRLGAIRLTTEEAKEAIMEELHLELHDMVSPRTRTDRNFRISAVRANDPDHPL